MELWKNLEMEPWKLPSARNGALEAPGSSKWNPGCPWALDMDPWKPWEARNEALGDPSCSKLNHGSAWEFEMDPCKLVETQHVLSM